MKFIAFTFPVLFFFFSCGTTPSSSKADSDSAKTVSKIDSVPALPKTPIAELLGGDTIVPSDASVILFHFDDKLNKGKSKKLSVAEVRKRFMPIDTACDDRAAGTLQTFFDLDSMKRNKNMPSDMLGMTVQVDVRVVDTLDVSPAFTTVLWTMYYTTEEACPFSEGTYYMVSTYDKGGKLISTQQMGKSTGGGDAPMFYSWTEKSNLFTDGSFKCVGVDTMGEEGDSGKPKYEVTKTVFKGVIGADGKIIKKKV